MTKFNPETCHRIIQGLEEGNYRKTAAALAGVSENTFYRWMDRGKNAKTGKYREFCESVKKAEEKAKAYHLQQIRKASENGSWQASAWFLERKFPQEWGRQQRVEVEHSGGIEQKHTGTVTVFNQSVQDKILREEDYGSDNGNSD